MRVYIAAVGKARGGPEQALIDRYVARIPWPITVREVEAKRHGGGTDAQRREEAALLGAAVPSSALLIALDERGMVLTSLAFAERIRGWRDAGVSDLAFLIGGAEGLDDSLRRRATLVLAFGPMTWPHLLARGMLTEQLYRAHQILAGHPYHRA